MVSPWKYKSASFLESDMGFFVDFSGEKFGIHFDVNGELSGYLSGNNSEHFNSLIEVTTTSKFALIPNEFVGVQMSELNLNLGCEFEGEKTFCFEGQSGQYHWMQALAKNAINVAEKQPNLVYVWLHQRELYLILIKNKSIYLANRYRVESHSEVLYFIAACIQDCKLGSFDFKIIADTSERELESLLYEGDRIGMEINGISHSIPQLGPFLSQKHIVANLLLISRCELPVEI